MHHHQDETPRGGTSGSPTHGDAESVRRRLTAARDLPEATRQAELAEVVADHLPFARRLGRRHAPTPAWVDDCEQVACMGLVLAVQRWDPSHGTTLSTFAVPTIVGELRRYLRDSTWWVRPPRTVQELALQVRATEDELRQQVGGEPSTEQVAQWLGVDEAQVREARRALAGRSPEGPDDQAEPRWVTAAPAGHVDEWLSLQPHLQALDPLDRTVLLRRYLEDETQGRIAASMGISQAQVSRRLQRALTTLGAQVQQQRGQDTA